MSQRLLLAALSWAAATGLKQRWPELFQHVGPKLQDTLVNHWDSMNGHMDREDFLEKYMKEVQNFVDPEDLNSVLKSLASNANPDTNTLTRILKTQIGKALFESEAYQLQWASYLDAIQHMLRDMYLYYVIFECYTL